MRSAISSLSPFVLCRGNKPRTLERAQQNIKSIHRNIFNCGGHVICVLRVKYPDLVAVDSQDTCPKHALRQPRHSKKKSRVLKLLGKIRSSRSGGEPRRMLVFPDSFLLSLTTECHDQATFRGQLTDPAKFGRRIPPTGHISSIFRRNR